MGFVLVVAVILVFAATTSAAALGAFNPGWEGASGLRSVAESTGTSPELILNTTSYDDAEPTGTTAVVLSPNQRYTDEESARIRQFVQNGGTLVVAEDFGDGGNVLLDRVGASARFDGRLLRDEVNYYRSPALIEAQNASETVISDEETTLTFNYGTAIEPGNATVAVRSSEFAYLDSNGNNELDDDERIDSYPVATVESVGDGRVVAVGDSSMFINTMLDRPGNRRFIERLFGSSERVLLDYSHSGQLPPLTYLLFVINQSPLLQVAVSVLGVVGVVVWVRRRPETWLLRRLVGQGGRSAGSPDPERLRSRLREDRPYWDDARVDRVVDSFVAESEGGPSLTRTKARALLGLGGRDERDKSGPR